MAMSPNDFDLRMMANALRMARRGLGRTAPNPSVGAVIADEVSGEVITRGWTQPGGRPHAEAHAIHLARGAVRGATMYVTLEPCAHHGQTPPCAETIIEAGLKRVVVGIEDPDVRTAGKGIALLRAAGIEVTQGVLADDCRWLTLGHILRVSEQRPFVQLKLALNAQGEIARGSKGKAAWVTGADARARGHLLRATTDAIIVGADTVIDDDPVLTCRLPGLELRSPARVILDSSLRMPATAKLLPANSRFAPTVIATTANSETPAAKTLTEAGAHVLAGLGPSGAARVDIRKLLAVLAGQGMTRVLVEGGPKTWRAFLDAGVVDEAVVYQASATARTIAATTIQARWLSGAPLALADQRRIGEDQELMFRRS